MESDLETISLIEHLSEAGFRASVVATYNCYFPFYEEVVLRRLVAAGCTHNVLMVDATRCAEAFASAELRPRRAGRDYTLIPVAVGGAFHPKMFLRLGKSKGALFVGSHNMTFAGFGLNDELTNAFRAEGASARSGAGPFRRAFEYLATHVPGALPDLVEAYEAVKQGVPWLEGPMAVGERERTLLTASTTGSDLWSQILPLVPRDVANAFICAPFFDPKLAFVRRLLADARPRALTIGVDPATVDIDPAVARTLDGVRFVNVAGIPKVDRPDDAEPYLHAKMLWFAGADAELLITGSANASVAAFLAPSAARNAEAVVADRRAGAADAIGIEALWAAPVITSAEWNAVSERRAIKLARSEEPRRRILVATPTSQGFLAQEPIRLGTVLKGMCDDDAILGDAVVGGAMGGRSIEAPELVRDEARFLETIGADEPLLVIVHRTEDIAKNLGGDTRKALRHALGALEEDPSQLDTLLKLTEKVIFDSDDVVRTTPFRAGGSTATPGEAEAPAGSLALDAMGRKRSRQRRSLASGDIAVLLDALMRRLGEGLTTATPPRPSNDREEVGADEEDGGELAREPPDHEELAQACCSKMRRLIRRMERQIELAAEPDRARRGIVQLAAVLAVVRALRLVERRPEWRRQQLRLVEPDDQWRIFEAAVLALTWGSEALAPRALLEANGEMFEELSMVAGLLGWLAWEMEIDIGIASERSGQKGVEEESWYGAQLFASLAPWLAPDMGAIAILKESVPRTPRYKIDGDRWLVVHLGLAASVDRLAADPGRVAKAGRAPRPGDLVVLSERFNPRVRVVLAVGAAGGDTKVTFYDHDEESGQRTFLASRVTTLAWEPLYEAIAATA